MLGLPVTGEHNEGVAATNATIIGSTPFQSSQFTTYFKVLKATHQLLAPGQTHVHRIKFTPNRVLNGEEEVNSNGNIKGFTIYTMMVIYSTPCDNNASTVLTCDSKISWVTRKSYRFKSILASSNKLDVANNLAVLTRATENQMNVDAGTAITNSFV